MRRGTLAIAAVCGLSLLASGCSGDEGGPGAEEIVIGVNIELSGPAAVQGAAYRNALDLVAEGINADGVLGGRKVKLLVRDNKSDAEESTRVTKSLIEEDEVVALIGGGSSPTTIPILDTVEELKVPTVSMGSSAAIVNPPGKRTFVFKTPADSSLVVDVMLAGFRAKGIRTVGFLSVDNAYGQAGAAAFAGGARKAGVTIVRSETFPPTARDYSGEVQRIVAKRPQAIVVWAVPPGAGTAARNIEQEKFTGAVYFDAGAGGELFVKTAGDAANGAFIVHPSVLAADQTIATTPLAAGQKRFFSAYSEKYSSFSGFASYAADALMLIVAAIEKARSTDRQKIRDALETLSLDGVTGSYAMSATNHGGVSRDALTVLTVRDGGWVLSQ